MQFIYDNFRKKPFKPLYNFFVPRYYRKKWDLNYQDIPTQQAIAEFWQQAISDYDQGRVPQYNFVAKQPQLIGKKIIWQFWGQGIVDLPPVTQLSFDSVDKYKGDFEVIRLTDQNLSNYLDFPELVLTKRSGSVFRPVFFSDLLRNALIYVYGGVWLDASVVLTDELPKIYQTYNFFIFSRDKESINIHWGANDTDFYFNWRDDFKVNFLSSIMFGKPHNELAKISLDLLIYFWQTHDKIEHYFFYQILLNELRQSKADLFDFPVVDDTLPHMMQRVIDKPCDQQRLTEIMEYTSMHKLNLHTKPKIKSLDNKLTYFGALNKMIYA